jgi:hypothetical protein
MPDVLDGNPPSETSSVASPGAASTWASVCLNCTAPIAGPFCGQCGQRALPPHPTIRELTGDAYNELAGWDGKFAVTVRTLLRSPGELTRVLLEGRRARFISPVRLYLTCSLVYFLVGAVVPAPGDGVEFEVGVGFGFAGNETTAGDAALAKAISSGTTSLSAAEREALENKIAETPAFLRPMIRAMADDYRGLSSRVTETMPRALFVLIPALALILALFHRGRPYPDHLYFAIHFQSFVFVMMTAMAVAMFSRAIPVIAGVQMVAMAWIVIYGVLAQRRVYGGSWLATGLKAVGVAAVYGALWGGVTIGVTLWAARAN